MLNNPAVSSEAYAVGGVWECCQPYGGELNGRIMNTDSGLSIRQEKKEKRIDFQF
jgi:hypothetical protein